MDSQITDQDIRTPYQIQPHSAYTNVTLDRLNPEIQTSFPKKRGTSDLNSSLRVSPKWTITSKFDRNDLNKSFTSVLKGYIGKDYQSSNTFRNSTSPISFAKANRFRPHHTGGSHVPFINTRDAGFSDSHKKGWGFGHSDRALFKDKEKAALPSPQKYTVYNLSDFYIAKERNKCYFGESREKVYKASDILNKKTVFENNKNVSPSTYSPSHKFVKKQSGIYSMRPHYERAEEIFKANEPRPAPDNYNIEERLVKSTRYSKVHAGGYSPKDGLQINKNPGPGHYRTASSIADESLKRVELNKTFYQSQRSWMSKGTSLQISPRNCSFALPGSGEPFTHTGAIKVWKSPEKRVSDMSFGGATTTLHSRTKVMDSPTKDTM